MEALKKAIREIPDFPKKGILFYDITTLLKDPVAFRRSIDALASKLEGKDFDAILGVESRGFIFAAALAYKLGKGLIVVRKPGKLPSKTLQATYELEYGTDTIEMHADAVGSDQKVVIVDDLLATGGTAQATAELVEKAGGRVEVILFLVELDFLKGREKLEGYETVSILNYSS
jgi:adenine phosphoribosyltransferase